MLIAPADQVKTAFMTVEGHFEYKRMAFGLTGVSAASSDVNNLLASY